MRSWAICSIAARVNVPDWWLIPTALIFMVLGLGLARWLAPAGQRPAYGSAIIFFLISAASFALELFLPWPEVSSLFAGLGKLAFALLVARVLFVIAFDGILARRHPAPRIARDIAQGLAFFLAALGALHSVGVEPGQLLTTSAVLSVVVGMALQETLGNLVAGLALQAERPFQLGDWVELHPSSGQNGAIGRVREINWRATRLHTLDNVDLVIPNAVFAKASFTNHDRPHQAPRRSVYFSVSQRVPPPQVHQLVLSAVRDAPGLLSRPEPSIVTFSFDERGVQYWLRYYIEDMGRRDGIDGGVRDRVWHALHRAGIDIEVPNRRLELHEVTAASLALKARADFERRLRALQDVELFKALSPEDLRILAERTVEAPYAPGEVVIRQGTPGREMYVVERGSLSVRIASEGGEREVAQVGAGSFFGEMSLLTGDLRSATVVTMERAELLVIDHASFKVVLEAHPEIAKSVGERLLERRAALAAAASLPVPESSPAEAADLVDRIRRFFGLRGA